MEASYEEQFTAFVDLLGFSEASAQTDDTTRLKVLDFLLMLSVLRGEFDVQTKDQENGKASSIKPAISTFSDHIVISYPLRPISADTGLDDRVLGFVIMNDFSRLLEAIAAAAFRIGFLIRGGATIGKLYHANGVVFGEALVEAFELESSTSIYPRVVLSPKIVNRPGWVDMQLLNAVKDNDGLYHVDYFRNLLFRSARPGNTWGPHVKAWLDDAVAVISRNLMDLESKGRLKEFSKWAWFARQFRAGLEKTNPKLLVDMGISPDAIEWPE
jgi:hypothetical protein